jgi:uncharacterized BrkB/YihY/UPF0761 family membrane protein
LTGAIATVGALASVANLGVSMAGFAAVLHSLSRIESKLDEVLSEVHHVRQTVQRMHMEQSALSLARIHAAYECLKGLELNNAVI